MDSQSIGPIGALLRQEALLRQKRLLHRQQQVVGDIRNRRASDGMLGSRRPSLSGSTQQDDRRQPFRAGIVSSTRPAPGQSVGAPRSSLGTRIAERRHSLQEPPCRTRRSSCDLGHRQRRSSLDSESSMEFMPRPRRSSFDSQASSELGSRQQRESQDSSEVSSHWRQFLQRNRDFASNRERALETKRKAKQEELDKACTFAPKVQDWGLSVETESSLRSHATNSTGSSTETMESSEIAQSKVASFCIRDDSDEAPMSTADCPHNNTVALDASSRCCTDSAAEFAVEENKVEDLDQHQVPEALVASKMPLEAWKEEEEDRVAVIDCKQGPAKLSCSPSGKLVVSNLASEVTLHDAWPRAKLLFAYCDDLGEKKPSIVSATASTEVSNCPSESGGPDNEDDDLDTLVANLRSHKVYSFHFSG